VGYCLGLKTLKIGKIIKKCMIVSIEKMEDTWSSQPKEAGEMGQEV
jgi:hypothetical protein